MRYFNFSHTPFRLAAGFLASLILLSNLQGPCSQASAQGQALQSGPTKPAPSNTKPAPSNTNPVSSKSPSVDLSLDQARLADRYARLEQVMLRLAELTASTDPRRAKVLRQVVAQAKNRDISVRYESLVQLLQNERLGLAERNQKELRGELQLLLDALLKENRSERIESDQKRLRHLLKDVNRLIKHQRGVKARTQGGEDTERLSEAQKKIAEKADALRKDLEQNGVPGQEEISPNKKNA